MQKIFDHDQLIKTMKRMSHEIIEKNENLNDLVFVGILKKGIPLMHYLHDNVYEISKHDIPMIELDIKNYRDDSDKQEMNKAAKEILKDKKVILVDDVLYTGRSVRAALDAIMDLGRAKSVQLAILIDRGHRELPIRADYIGKNLPTAKNEKVYVNFDALTVEIIK